MVTFTMSGYIGHVGHVTYAHPWLSDVICAYQAYVCLGETIKSPRSPRTSQDSSLRFLLVLRCLWGSCSTIYCIRWIHCRPVEMLHEIMQIGLPSQMHLSLLQHNHEIMCHYCAWLSCFLMLSVGYLIDQLNESKWSIKENAEGVRMS